MQQLPRDDWQDGYFSGDARAEIVAAHAHVPDQKHMVVLAMTVVDKNGRTVEDGMQFAMSLPAASQLGDLLRKAVFGHLQKGMPQHQRI